MRIVVATGIFPPDIGGPATHARDLREEFTARGHDVTVLTVGDLPRPQAEGKIVRYPRSWPWPLRNARVALWLVTHRNRFDVVYATGLHAPSALAARFVRRPLIVKIVGDSVWERARRRGLTRDSFEDFQMRGHKHPSIRSMRRVRDRALRRAAYICVPSRYLERVVQGWLGDDSPPIVVIPNGVRSPGRATSRDKKRANSLHCVAVGRLVEHKNLDVLIEAVGGAGGVFLDIVGEGPAAPELLALTAKLGLGDRVRFRGAVPQEDIFAVLREADVLVSASTYEGLPHTTLEALAVGTPVVTSGAGGTVEAVEDGDNGLIVHDGSAAGFVATFEKLKNDPDLLAALNERALQDTDRWTFRRTADEIEALLVKVLRPTVIFLAKTRLAIPLSPDLAGKLSVLKRYLTPVLFNVGRPGVHRIDGARALLLPRIRPGFLGGAVFYLVAPPVAVIGALFMRARAIVCQSPYEAFGVQFLARLIPASRRPTVVVEVHGDWRTAPRLYGSRARRLVAHVSDRMASRAVTKADRVRVIGEYTEQMVRAEGYTGPLDRFIAFSDFSSFMEPVEPVPPHSTAAFVGVFERYKGVDLLPPAWKSVIEKDPDARLLMVGSGSLERHVRRDIERLGLKERVEVTGKVSRSEVRAIMDDSALLVLPSRSEGLGLVVLEAMARGRAVVASRVGGIPEILEDGVTGRLVEPGSAEELARAIRELLSDRRLLVDMGERGRARVEELDPLGDFESGIARLAVHLSR